VADFEEMDGPIILCCLSGGRSGQATGFLQAQGIECYNGGGWMDVTYALNQSSKISFQSPIFGLIENNSIS
jgi:phage shock protein E